MSWCASTGDHDSHLHGCSFRQAQRRAGLTWRQFLEAQTHAIIACDFLVVETVLLNRL
jgi:hypothetical protein